MPFIVDNLPPGPFTLVNGSVTVAVTVYSPIEFKITASDGMIDGTSGYIQF